MIINYSCFFSDRGSGEYQSSKTKPTERQDSEKETEQVSHVYSKQNVLSSSGASCCHF